MDSPNKISQQDYDKTNERSKVAYHDVLMSMIGTVGLVSFISRKEINFAIKNVALFRTSQDEELTLSSKEGTYHIYNSFFQLTTLKEL